MLYAKILISYGYNAGGEQMGDNIKSKCCNEEYDVIKTEIPTKRKGYIVARKSSQDKFFEKIDKLCAELIQAEAEKVYAACVDKNVYIPNAEFQTSNYTFKYEHEIDYLEVDLNVHNFPILQETITLCNLTHENVEDYLRIYNETFYYVPNSATYNYKDADRLLDEKGMFQAGFLQREGVKIGIFEISFEQEIPEIACIGILENHRGQNMGRNLIYLLLTEISTLGYQKVGLRVSTKNENAYHLYLKTGFEKVNTVSRWYFYDDKCNKKLRL